MSINARRVVMKTFQAQHLFWPKIDFFLKDVVVIFETRAVILTCGNGVQGRTGLERKGMFVTIYLQQTTERMIDFTNFVPTDAGLCLSIPQSPNFRIFPKGTRLQNYIF